MPVYASVCIKHVEKQQLFSTVVVFLHVLLLIKKKKQQLFSLWEREGLSNRDYAWVFVTGKKISR